MFDSCFDSAADHRQIRRFQALVATRNDSWLMAQLNGKILSPVRPHLTNSTRLQSHKNNTLTRSITPFATTETDCESVGTGDSCPTVWSIKSTEASVEKFHYIILLLRKLRIEWSAVEVLDDKPPLSLYPYGQRCVSNACSRP